MRVDGFSQKCFYGNHDKCSDSKCECECHRQSVTQCPASDSIREKGEKLCPQK